jgi:hypothetical protein
MNARLVLHRDNRGWILEKFAVRLVEHLGACGVTAEIGDEPSPSADVNHWLLYLYVTAGRSTPSTALITHVDQFAKLRVLKGALDSLDAGICLSQMTVDTLTRRGVEPRKLCYVTPGHDGAVPAKRLVIGITSRAYGDGRKREGMLVELSRAMRLDRFHFEIIGDGWEPIISHLREAGASVRHFAGTDDYQRDYALTLERIPTFDYYLYTGLDEGSMGFLDALSAGVATIVTPQGFHLDVPGGITHPFTDVDELIAVFQHLAAEVDRRAASVAALTWARYAREHAVIWRAIAAGQTPAEALAAAGQVPTGGSNSAVQKMLEDAKFYSGPVVGRLKKVFKPKPSK